MRTDEKRLWIQNLYSQQEGRLFRYTMKFISRAGAAEVVQEAFLQLLQQPDPKKIKGHELPWLFRVCRNKALDRLKKEKPMKSLESSEEIPYEGVSAEKQIDQKEDQNLAMELLEILNAKQREVVRLKFQEGFSYREIAEVTGHSSNHVGVILHESIGRLRKELEQRTKKSKVVSNEK